MRRRIAWIGAALVAATCGLTVAVAEAGLPDFPAKTYSLGGGTIELQAGVWQNARVRPMVGFGKLRYPVQYFLIVTNDTGSSIWIAAELTFPGKKPKKWRLFEMTPGNAKLVTYNRFGVITDQEIVWEVTAYSDSKRSKTVAELRAPMRFEKREVKVFLKAFSLGRSRPVLSGLVETDPPEAAAKASTPPPAGAPGAPRPAEPILEGETAAPESPGDAKAPEAEAQPSPGRGPEPAGPKGAAPPDVPGTLAGPELQADVIRTLVADEHSRNAACEAHVVRAEPLGDDELSFIGRASEKGAKAERSLRKAKLLVAERWYLESCGLQRVYEVDLMPSKDGGTDILAQPLGEPPEP